MIIGKDAPLGPSCVKASNISSTSAVISWLPSNSNFQHTVCLPLLPLTPSPLFGGSVFSDNKLYTFSQVSVNGVEVRAVKPGVYRHTITGITLLNGKHQYIQ